MGEDDLTLTPVYRFEWHSDAVEADGSEVVRSRRTDDADAFEEEPSPDAVENLAEMGRADPDCEVTLVGMGA